MLDVDDLFPLNASEFSDFDMDGLGDNADTDDDNDGWMDTDETVCGTDPRDGFVSPDDYDSDMICDVVDDDDDNDGIIDVNDVFPKNAAEWPVSYTHLTLPTILLV